MKALKIAVALVAFGFSAVVAAQSPGFYPSFTNGETYRGGGNPRDAIADSVECMAEAAPAAGTQVLGSIGQAIGNLVGSKGQRGYYSNQVGYAYTAEQQQCAQRKLMYREQLKQQALYERQMERQMAINERMQDRQFDKSLQQQARMNEFNRRERARDAQVATPTMAVDVNCIVDMPNGAVVLKQAPGCGITH